MLLTAAAKCSRGLVVASGGRRYVRSIGTAASSSGWNAPLRSDPPRRRTMTSPPPQLQHAARPRRWYYHPSRPLPDATIQEGVIVSDANDEEAEAMASLSPAQNRMLSERRSAYRRLVTQVGDRHPDAVDALSSLGDAYWECGMLGSARETHEAVLTHLFELHGSDNEEEGVGIGWVDHPSVASTLHKLGSVHARAGDGDEAMRWYARALEMKRALAVATKRGSGGEGEREMYDPYLVEIGTTLNGMAMLHAESGGRDDVALETFLEAERVTRSATISTSTSDEEEALTDEDEDVVPHPNVASICENAAALHVSAAKDYRSAFSHLEEAVRIVRHHDGDDGERIAGLLMNVGDCHYGLDRHSEAKDSYGEALNLLRAVDGAEEDRDRVNPMEAVLLHNLGLTCGNIGELDEALEHYEKSWELKKRLLGEEHPECASTLNCMGAVYGTKGEKDRALSHFREALRIYRTCLREEGVSGDDEDADPNVINTKRNIALVEASNL